MEEEKEYDTRAAVKLPVPAGYSERLKLHDAKVASR